MMVYGIMEMEFPGEEERKNRTTKHVLHKHKKKTIRVYRNKL